MLSPVIGASLILAALIGQVLSKANTPSCLDDAGNQVDWYIAYKFPTLADDGYPFSTGYAYAYMTSKSIGMEGGKAKPTRSSPGKDKLGPDTQWAMSAKLITDADSMVLKTLDLAYDDELDDSLSLNTIFYNDHPPEVRVHENAARLNSNRAHAKGAVIVDEASGDGLWLSHSTPRFPQIRREKLVYANNSRIYGQTFICLNFDLNESGEAIFKHLINMRPLVYESNLSDEMLSWMPELRDLKVDAFKGRRKSKVREDGRLAQTITTRAGQELSLFSKSGSFRDDLFGGWLDDELGSSLLVETWRNGSGNTLQSSCPKNEPHVNNVKDLRVVTGNVKVHWTYRQDHSKWAISDEQDLGVVCLSDMNRAQSQFARGGGAICIKCPKCWNIFSDTIVELEPCPIATQHVEN